MKKRVTPPLFFAAFAFRRAAGEGCGEREITTVKDGKNDKTV